MKKITTIAMTLLLSTSLYAIECKEDGTQIEMNQCAYEDFQKADKELNSVYKELRAKKKEDETYLKNLKTSQRAWIKFRDAELETIFSCEGGDTRMCFGSMYGLLFNNAKTELTQQRVEQLKKYVKDSEL
ncbi:MAG: DUF1311 domain-containing protein [Epsilonproteobacteria bacterium]|nr:DUF1311 domain-containing protein [Campylobacterota bacterium]